MARDAHTAETEDGSKHGPTPDELMRLAGAFVILDKRSGKVTSTCFRIRNRSIGVDHSTVAEAETVVYGLREVVFGAAVDRHWRRETRDDEGRGGWRQEEGGKGDTDGDKEEDGERKKGQDSTAKGKSKSDGAEKVRTEEERKGEDATKRTRGVIFTDNESVTVAATKHVFGTGTSLGKRFKLCIANPLREINNLVEMATTQKDMEVEVKFDRNEHGRKWGLNRHTLMCRLNRVCDMVAGIVVDYSEEDVTKDDPNTHVPKGGAYADARTWSAEDGEGGPGTVTFNGLRSDKNLRSEIRDRISLRHASVASTGKGVQSIAPKQAMEGHIDMETTVAARKMMADGALEDACRALLHLSRYSMTELHKKARVTPGGKQVEELLDRCGPLRGACPFCAHLTTTGQIHAKDGHDHARFECKCEAMVSARQYAEAALSERLTREGRCFWADRDASSDKANPYSDRTIRQLKWDDTSSWFKKSRTENRPTQRMKWNDKSGIVDLLPGESGSMQVSQYRVHALAESCLSTIQGEDCFAGTVVRMVLHNVTRVKGKVQDAWTGAAAGQLHAAYKLWARTFIGIKREVLQTPLTISSGIFPEKATMYSVSIPKEDRRSVPSELLEDTESMHFAATPWKDNCMVSVTTGARDLAERILTKVFATVQRGFRVLVIMEMGAKETQNPAIRLTPPRQLEETVTHHHLASFPKGTTLWAGSEGTPGAWEMDSKGKPYGTNEDGAWDVRRTREEVAVGFNANHLEMHLYCPKDERKAETFAPINEDATRALTYIVANTSAPMPVNGYGAPVQLKRELKGGWTRLNLRDMPGGTDYDPYQAVRIMGWQPIQGHVPDPKPGHRERKPVTTGPMKDLDDCRTIEHDWLQERVLADGIVLAPLVKACAERDVSRWTMKKQGGRLGGSSGNPGKDTKASAARIVAGRQYDLHNTVWPTRAALVATALEKLGAPMGSLAQNYEEAPPLAPCDCCGDLVTNRWHLNYPKETRREEGLVGEAPKGSMGQTPGLLEGGGLEKRAVCESVIARRMRMETATTGPDLPGPQTPEITTTGGRRREATTSRDVDPARMEHINIYAKTYHQTRRTRSRPGVMAATPQVVPTQTGPIAEPKEQEAQETKRLRMARELVRKIVEKRGALVCSTCAAPVISAGTPREVKALEGRTPRSTDENSKMFAEWSAVAGGHYKPLLKAMKGFPEAWADAMGRSTLEKNLIGQRVLFARGGATQGGTVFTVSPSTCQSRGNVAFVQMDEEETSQGMQGNRGETGTRQQEGETRRAGEGDVLLSGTRMAEVSPREAQKAMAAARNAVRYPPPPLIEITTEDPEGDTGRGDRGAADNESFSPGESEGVRGTDRGIQRRTPKGGAQTQQLEPTGADGEAETEVCISRPRKGYRSGPNVCILPSYFYEAMGPRGEGTFSRLTILQAELFRRSEILVFPVPPRTRWRSNMSFLFCPFTDGWAMVVVQFSQPGVAEVWTAAKEGLLEASMGTALAKEVTDFIRENVPARRHDMKKLNIRTHMDLPSLEPGNGAIEVLDFIDRALLELCGAEGTREDPKRTLRNLVGMGDELLAESLVDTPETKKWHHSQLGTRLRSEQFEGVTITSYDHRLFEGEGGYVLEQEKEGTQHQVRPREIRTRLVAQYWRTRDDKELKEFVNEQYEKFYGKEEREQDAKDRQLELLLDTWKEHEGRELEKFLHEQREAGPVDTTGVTSIRPTPGEEYEYNMATETIDGGTQDVCVIHPMFPSLLEIPRKALQALFKLARSTLPNERGEIHQAENEENGHIATPVVDLYLGELMMNVAARTDLPNNNGHGGEGDRMAHLRTRRKKTEGGDNFQYQGGGARTYCIMIQLSRWTTKQRQGRSRTGKALRRGRPTKYKKPAARRLHQRGRFRGGRWGKYGALTARSYVGG